MTRAMYPTMAARPPTSDMNGRVRSADSAALTTRGMSQIARPPKMSRATK